MALGWPWDVIWCLPCFVCLEYGMSASRRPYGSLMAPLLQPYSKLVVAATTVSVLYGRLPVSLQSLNSFWSHEFYNHQVVAITFATITIAAHKILRFLRVTCTNHRPQNHMVTAPRQHDMWTSINDSWLIITEILRVHLDWTNVKEKLMDICYWKQLKMLLIQMAHDLEMHAISINNIFSSIWINYINSIFFNYVQSLMC